jgi:hypothetical protein
MKFPSVTVICYTYYHFIYIYIADIQLYERYVNLKCILNHPSAKLSLPIEIVCVMKWRYSTLFIKFVI